MYRFCISAHRNKLIPLTEAWYSKPSSSIFGTTAKTENFPNEDLNNLDTTEILKSQFGVAVRDAVPRSNTELYDVVKRFDEMCYHGGAKRELYTGDIFMLSYKALEQPQNLTVDNIKRAAMLCWAFENATLGFGLADDIVDNTKVRWELPCWHTLPHVGLRALIDMKLFTMGSSQIIRKYFKDYPTYIHLQTLFNEFRYVFALGQTYDLHNSSLFKKTRDANLLSLSNFRKIAKVKSGFTMYVGPPLAAVYLANLDPKIYMQSKHIFDTLAIHRQAQNDMEDFFSEAYKISKCATDVWEGKCSWITGNVMAHGSEAQKKLFLENYGRGDSECPSVVHGIANELNMLGRFREYTQDVVNECREHVKTTAHSGISKIINLLIDGHVNIKLDF